MEYWDVYDEYRRPTGRVRARGEDFLPGEYHQVVSVCVFGMDGRMLIQKRADCKKQWPGRWDISMIGNAVAGEDARQAARRELREELGIDVDFTHRRPNLTLTYQCGFNDYFLIRQDLDISRLRLQEDEVAAAAWADRDQVRQRLAERLFIPYYPAVIDLFFEMQVGYMYMLK